MDRQATSAETLDFDVVRLPARLDGLEDPDEIVDALEELNLEWHVSDEGTLFVKSWEVAAEELFPPDLTTELQERQDVAEEDELNWISRNITELRTNYGGQWIAVSEAQIVANADTLPGLLEALDDQDREDVFVTTIPEEEVTTHVTFGSFRA